MEATEAAAGGFAGGGGGGRRVELFVAVDNGDRASVLPVGQMFRLLRVLFAGES